MAGYGKNPRAGKRGGSSSSSVYVSTTMVVLLVGFCLYGVYMFSSSHVSPPHSTPSTNPRPHHNHQRTAVPLPNRTPPRTVLRDPPPTAPDEDEDQSRTHDDTQANLPDDAVRGDDDNQEKVTAASAGTEEDSLPESDGLQHERRQQEEEVETHREEFQHLQQHHQQQQEQPQPQQQQQQQEEVQDDAQQNQSQDQQQSNDEQQQQMDQSESNENEERPSQEETNESQQQQSQNQQQIIQQVTDGSHSQSEEGEGITSQSQIEHDSDGTTEDHQHQHQQEEQQRHQQRQQEQQQQEQQEEQQQQQQQEEQPQQQQEEQPQPQQQEEQQESSQTQQNEEESTAGGGGTNENSQQNEGNANEGDSLPEGAQSAVPIENESNQNTWATQADQSSNEKERRKENEPSQPDEGGGDQRIDGDKHSGYEWELCNVTAGPDYIPCLDNEKAIKQLRSFGHFEHRERHCPEESPTCLVPLPNGYKRSISWPESRDRIWYNNVPRTKLAEVKGHQNWVKVAGEYLTFPGGGTQFIHGALHYIDFIQKSMPEIAWGKRTRVILDVGCGVASFGGFLFERDVLAMSFAPKDEHEAQVQFALERGIPAISAVMGSQRLPFPGRVFDIVHCARCRVPWHANDGALLLELNRVLRPGGFFVWSATPVYQTLKEDVEIWKAMTALTKSMCWELATIKKDKLNSVGAAIFRKPVTNDCYDNRQDPKPPMCNEDDDPNAAWYVPLQSCMHRVPVDPSERGANWPQEWPQRLQAPPYWLSDSQMGVYGRPAPDDFTKDYEHWKRVMKKSYLTGLGIDWSKVRNVMDMRAVYGGFAAALRDKKVWVMNLVNIDSPDTLPIIYERGLFGMYHDWCESFSTYPRTYDLLHAERLFSQLKKRCKILPVIAEVDRIARPGGKLIVRDEAEVVSEVEGMLKSLHWEIRLTYSKNQEGMLCAEKSDWRP